MNRFRYYGELLDPELSNLRIATASVGFRFLDESSVEFLYHFYKQVDATTFLRDALIKRAPTGRSHSIGQESDVAIGIEEWEHLELELIGAAFRAGAAYGREGGEWSYLTALKLKLNY